MDQDDLMGNIQRLESTLSELQVLSQNNAREMPAWLVTSLVAALREVSVLLADQLDGEEEEEQPKPENSFECVIHDEGNGSRNRVLVPRRFVPAFDALFSGSNPVMKVKHDHLFVKDGANYRATKAMWQKTLKTVCGGMCLGRM